MSVDDLSWRPLGVDTDEDVAVYDALHDGLPTWLADSVWAWVADAVTLYRPYRDGSGRVAMLDVELAEAMCQTLRIPLPSLRATDVNASTGSSQRQAAMKALRGHRDPLQIIDYLLAHGAQGKADALEQILERGKSAWAVGTRSGKPGLVRRVPLGVQIAADSVMARAGQAGVRLAKAWEALYGIGPDPSEAYRLAILAVEDAAVPVVSPSNARASLGTVLRQMEGQGDWQLPMKREHPQAPSRETVVALMRMLWHGQHDRHGGQPSAPGNVTEPEAVVALSVAVSLVQLFDAGLVQRAE